MKKILYVATVDIHIKSFHLPYLKMLKENGYEVHVATNGDEQFPYCDVKHKICIERSPFKLNNLKAIKQLKRIIDEEKFDIIHCHTPMGSVVTRLAAKEARKNGTRVIYTCHGFHFYKGAPIKNWLLFYPVEWYLAKFTDTLITINQEDYKRAQKKFGKRCKDIQYVPGVGIDTKKFDISMTEEEKIEYRKSLGLKNEDFVLTCVARLDKNKNQGFLIKCMRKLVNEDKNIHLLLVGRDELNGKYQKMVQRMNLENNVHFLGNRNDVPQLLKISDVVVSASKREGLPVNVLEAFASGVQVVALECRGMRDLIKDDGNGFIVNNEYEFVQKIEKIYNDSKLTKKIGKNIINISNNYNVDKIGEKLKKIYFKKKKIIHILASNNYSGAENVVCSIMDNLKDKYDMVYCSPQGPIEGFLEEKNINYIPLKKLSIKEVRRVIDEYNPAIIHAHDFRAGCICAKLKKNRYLITHIHNNSPWIKKINLNTMLFLYIGIKSNKILTVSDSIEKEYIFSKFIKNKIINIGNPVSREKILKKIESLKREKIYDICCTARISASKNPLKFLNIIKELKQEFPNINAIWIGDGEMKEIFIQKIKDLELDKNVKLVGFQKNPYEYMMQSKIFLLTSDWEGYGLVAFEALTLGLPCVVSNVGGLPNIVDENCGALCKNNDISEYVSNIKKLLLDEKKLKIFSENASNKSKQLDNFSEYMSRLSKIYDMEV